MNEGMRIVPLSRLVEIGVFWFVVGVCTGAAALTILTLSGADPAPRTPTIAHAGPHGTVVRFDAVRNGLPMACTLSLNAKTNLWSLTC